MVNPRSANKKQRGVALIVILLILAIMVSIAATMSERLFVNFKRAENRLTHQQAYWYSLGVEALAIYGIKESYDESDTINLSQVWALKEQVYPLDYGQASGSIRDMQSCFNVNALSNQEQKAGTTNKPFLVTVFQTILEESQVDSYQSEVIAESAWEYMDADDTSKSSFGVEDSFYEALDPPYLTANGLLADSSELLAIQQMDQKVMNSIDSVVCAIPNDDWRLNVNTIDEKGAVILSALFSPHLSLSDAQNLVKNRPFDGWAKVSDFMSESKVASIEQDVRDKVKGYLTIESQYFELDVQVMVNESRVRLRSLLYSKDKKDVAIIRRRFGGISE